MGASNVIAAAAGAAADAAARLPAGVAAGSIAAAGAGSGVAIHNRTSAMVAEAGTNAALAAIAV
jgi:hypothetical protein